jgi:predicted CoA-binding protein
MRVLIVGASRNPERYSYLAMKRLIDAGHEVILFNPALDAIEGIPVVNRLSDVPIPVDTVTLYVGPKHLEPMVDDILALSPRRIISNPGSETPLMADKALDAGIEYVEACTLVLLATHRF